MFQGLGTAMSTGIRKAYQLNGLQVEQKLIQEKARKYGGINKVQVFKNKMSEKTLIMAQRFSEDDIHRLKDHQLTEDRIRFHNQQFIFFAYEFPAYFRQEDFWLAELDTEDILKIYQLLHAKNQK